MRDTRTDGPEPTPSPPARDGAPKFGRLLLVLALALLLIVAITCGSEAWLA